MNTKSISSLVLGLALVAAQADAADWMTDLPAAQARAKAENKMVLVNFTGSDWCSWCIRLKNEVFSKPAFETYANNHLVLVELDFPKRKAQNAALKKANEALAQHYQVRSFPTVLVLDSAGNKAGQLGYMEGGPTPFVSELTRLANTQPTARGTPPAKAETAPPPPPPPFAGAPLAPPPRHEDLVLKGISGPKGRRLALINNQTLGEGESGMVRVADSQVKVRCVEIREQSVIVAIGGSNERREVRMRGGF